MKGVFRRIGMTLVPTSEEGREALLSIKDGRECMVDTRGARNLLQHKLYFALCRLCADATDDDSESVRKWLLHATNNVDVWFDPNGNMHVEAKSMAFESMEQAVFNNLFQRSVNLIAERLSVSPKEVRDRFNDMVDPAKGYSIR
jgi:hypothetical protein